MRRSTGRMASDFASRQPMTVCCKVCLPHGGSSARGCTTTAEFCSVAFVRETHNDPMPPIPLPFTSLPSSFPSLPFAFERLWVARASLRKRVRLRGSQVPEQLHPVLGHGGGRRPQLRALRVRGRLERRGLWALPRRVRVSGQKDRWACEMEEERQTDTPNAGTRFNCPIVARLARGGLLALFEYCARVVWCW